MKNKLINRKVSSTDQIRTSFLFQSSNNVLHSKNEPKCPAAEKPPLLLQLGK